MKGSVFSSIIEYFKEVGTGVRSLARACVSALPYLTSVRTGDLRKEVTEQYPDPVSSRTPDDLPPRSRGLLHNDILICTGCRDCEQLCPVECIQIETDEGPDPAKTWVSVFNIDFSKCVFCGLCVEACQPASLKHTRKYEGAALNTSEMIVQFGRGTVTPEQRELWQRPRDSLGTDMRRL